MVVLVAFVAMVAAAVVEYYLVDLSFRVQPHLSCVLPHVGEIAHDPIRNGLEARVPMGGQPGGVVIC